MLLAYTPDPNSWQACVLRLQCAYLRASAGDCFMLACCCSVLLDKSGYYAGNCIALDGYESM
jgi:hypothetical protein